MSKVREDKNLIIGLDIGTSKIVTIVAELLPDGTTKVIGLGQHPSRGLKKGVVVNIDSTMQSIQRSVEEADGRLQNQYRVYWDCRQPCKKLEFSWHGKD